MPTTTGVRDRSRRQNQTVFEYLSHLPLLEDDSVVEFVKYGGILVTGGGMERRLRASTTACELIVIHQQPIRVCLLHSLSL